MVPVFAAIGAIVNGLEKPNWRTSGGLILSIGGAIILVTPNNSPESPISGPQDVLSDIAGVSILLLWCLCMAVYYIIQKPTLAKYPPLAVTAWEYIVATVVLSLPTLFTIDKSQSWGFSWTTCLVLAFCIVFNSVAKYPLSAMCNKSTSVTMLTCWSTLSPLLTALLTYIFLDGKLLWRYLIGGVPVLCGTYFISVKSTPYTRDASID